MFKRLIKKLMGLVGFEFCSVCGTLLNFDQDPGSELESECLNCGNKTYNYE